MLQTDVDGQTIKVRNMPIQQDDGNLRPGLGVDNGSPSIALYWCHTFSSLLVLDGQTADSVSCPRSRVHQYLRTEQSIGPREGESHGNLTRTSSHRQGKLRLSPPDLTHGALVKRLQSHPHEQHSEHDQRAQNHHRRHVRHRRRQRGAHPLGHVDQRVDQHQPLHHRHV